jgi:hypothetical protein
MKALAMITAALMSASMLSGCAHIDDYMLGYQHGLATGEIKGYEAGVDAYENKQYAASIFAQKYEQLDFNAIKFFYLSKCEQNLVSRSIDAMSRGVLGLSLQSADRKSCAVFFQKPASPHDDRMTTLGHEVAHCLYCAYHTEEKDMKDFKDDLTAYKDAIFSSFLFCSDIDDSEKNRLLDAWKVM